MYGDLILNFVKIMGCPNCGDDDPNDLNKDGILDFSDKNSKVDFIKFTNTVKVEKIIVKKILKIVVVNYHNPNVIKTLIVFIVLVKEHQT